MPDESAPHERTWMAFGAQERIWGRRLLPEVRRDLAELARTIARYEPVVMLVREQEHALARSMVGPEVELLPCPLDDLWIRDTGPVFVVGPDGWRGAVDFNFNGWGGKQRHDRDARVAAFVAHQAGVPRIRSSLVLEGGSLEVDGAGRAILTESCILHRNRNPGVGREEVEAELAQRLGVEEVLWLPGIRDHDITDGHTDFYARFAGPDRVLVGYDPDPDSYDHAVTRRHLEILRRERNEAREPFELVVLEAPRRLRVRDPGEDFAAGYVGFYVCNDAVILQGFGDPRADAAAREAVADAFPGRRIETVAIDGIAAGGGTVHCATQQEPRA